MVAIINNITIGVNLIDDYVLTQEAPVASQLTRQLFTVVQNPASAANNASELLTINGDGDPVHFYPDASSQSGWSTTTISVTQPANTGTCNRIIGFYHQNVLNALFYYPLTGGAGSAAVWMQSSQPGTWTTATLSPTAEDWIGFTYQTDQYVDSNGNAYFYGITGNVSPHSFFVLTYAEDPQTGKLAWIPIAEQFPSEFSPQLANPDTAAFLMTEGTGGAGSVTILWVDNDQISHQDATITWTNNSCQFQWAGQSATFDPNVGTLTADNLYGIPGDFGSGNILILDSDKLYLVTDFYAASPTLTALTGNTADGQPGSATSVGVGVDASGIVTIFGVEGGSSNLWYLAQTDASSLTFGSWVNLGGSLYAVNCPTYMRAAPELFSAGTGTGTPAAYHTGQNISDAGDETFIWSTRKIFGPPPTSDTTPANTATYSMEIQALDSGQNPVAGGMVTITADQAVTVIWNAIASHIGPNTPLVVETDANGQATVLYEAVGLTPPAITFTAYDTSENVSASRWCRGDVVQYIQSLDDAPPPTPDDSVAPQLNTVTGSELISNNLTGGDYSQSGPADSAAQAINSAGSYMVQNADDSSAQGMIDVSRIRIPHWQIDFSHPDGPCFRVLSDEEATALLAGLPAPGQELGGGIGKAFGDVSHFFKHEIDQLEKFSATLQNDVLTIVFNDLAPFVISTIKQAGAACETIFAKIKNLADEIYTAMEDVIAWLKMLFDWGDILNTHTAIKSTVTQTLSNMENSIAGAETDLKQYFSSIETEVTKVFDNLEQYFDSSTSFNDMANAAQTGTTALSDSNSNVLAAATILNKENEYASKCKYIYSRSKPYFGNIGSQVLTAPKPGLGESDPTQSIIQAVQTYILDPTNSQNKSYFTEYFDTLYQTILNCISDATEFFDLIILTFLEAAKDLTLFVISAIENVLESIIKLLAQAISAFENIIKAKIDIPIVSWLWKTFISPGNDLTLLDLACLIAAVPATILYKLLYGDNKPPFNSTTLGELTNGGLAWPTLPTSTVTDTATLQRPTSTQSSSDYIVPLEVVAGISVFFAGIVTVAADSKAADGETDDTAKTLSVISVVLATLQAGAGAPYNVFCEAPADRSNADNWAISAWTASLAQLSCDLCFVAVGATNTLTEFVATVGPTADTALGICQEACGVVACTYQSNSESYSGWNCTLDIVAPISPSLRFMLDCGEDAAAFLMAADAVLYEGTMAVTIPAAGSG